MLPWKTGLMRILIYLVSLIICSPGIALGSDAIDFDGKIQALAFGYLEKGDTKHQHYGEIQFKPDITLYPSDVCLVASRFDVRQDTENYSHGYIDNVYEAQHRYAVNINELYLEAWKGYFNFKLGKQIFDWSKTDTISPNDNSSTRDWTDIVEFERIGIPAINLRIGFDTFFEAVYMPWFSVSKLPDAENRWYPNLPVGMSLGKQEADESQEQYAFRIGSVMSGFDLSAAYFHGYSYSPSYRLNIISASDIELIPTYRIQDAYSISGAREFFSFNIRGEAGYFDQDRADDFFQYVIGIDREWVALFSEIDSLYLLIQYMDETVTNHDSPLPFDTIDFRRILSDSIAWKSKYFFDPDTWTIQIEGSYNFSDHDCYVQPSILFTHSNIISEFGYCLFAGPEDSFWGSYDDNDRFYLKLTWLY